MAIYNKLILSEIPAQKLVQKGMPIKATKQT